MILLSSNGAGSILLLVGYIAIFAAIMYFAAIRPQKKQQKKQQEMINSMEKGDSVLTSGFYGVVIDITDDTVIVEFGSNKNCRIPMQKSAIVQIEKAEA